MPNAVSADDDDDDWFRRNSRYGDDDDFVSRTLPSYGDEDDWTVNVQSFGYADDYDDDDKFRAGNDDSASDDATTTTHRYDEQRIPAFETLRKRTDNAVVVVENGTRSDDDDDIVVDGDNNDATFCPVVSRKLAALRKKYEKPLVECYETVKDKLKWVETPLSPPTVRQRPASNDSAVPPPKRPTGVKRPKYKSEKKLAVPIVMVESNTSGERVCGVKFYEPPPPPVEMPPPSIVCGYFSRGKPCPFGDRCKFAHRRVTTTTRGRDGASDESSDSRRVVAATKKMWLCRNFVRFNSCRLGAACAYAHSVDELRANVARCRFDSRCLLVEYDETNGVYVNVVDGNDNRRCARLHGDESIYEFVRRTQPACAFAVRNEK